MDKMTATLLLIVLYCMASPIVCQDFEVKVNTPSLTALTVSNPTFSCKYNIPVTAIAVQVLWFKYMVSSASSQHLWDAKYTAAASGSYSKAVGYGNPKVTGASASDAMLASHYIKILNIQQEDAGDYYCHVRYWQDGQRYGGYSPQITLTVHTPPQPKLTVFSNTKVGLYTSDILEGVFSYVQCRSPLTFPDEEVILTIFKDNDNQSCYTPSGISGVHICQVDVIFSRSDNRAWNLWCRATWRGILYDTRDHLVDVQFKASKVTMTQPFPLSVTEGSRVSATCKTDSANPTAVITWTRGGGQISEGTIYTITTSEEKGMFNANIRISTLSFLFLVASTIVVHSICLHH